MRVSSFVRNVQAGFDQLARGEGRAYDKTSGRELADRIESRGRGLAPRNHK